MKKHLFLISLLFATTATVANAQLLKKFGYKLKQKTNEKVDQKTDQAAGKVVDAPENVLKNDGTNNNPTPTPKPNANNNSTTITPKNGETPKPNEAAIDYGSFDYIPGDSILFEDEFINESINEIPSLWIPANGKVEIVKLDGKNVMGLLDGDPTVFPRMKKYSYLPPRFTVEYDFLCKQNAGKSNDEATGDGNGSGHSTIFFYSPDKDNKGSASDALGDFGNYLQISHNGSAVFSTYNGQYTKGDKAISIPTDLNNKWIHVSVSVTETNMKVYINSQRVMNVPIQTGRAQSISLTGDGSEYEYNFKTFIRNVRIAAGLKPPYKQGVSQLPTTFVARGIKFDYQQATLKAESVGELNNVLNILKDHPSAKYEIGGHTSKTGTAATAANQKLSDDRTKAVKEKLIAMGIDATRLTTKGYGETKPIADNNTPEGRANNQRVEFTLIK